MMTTEDDPGVMSLTREQRRALEIILFACAILAMAYGFVELLDMPVDEALDLLEP
jgi:hypothetical protein